MPGAAQSRSVSKSGGGARLADGAGHAEVAAMHREFYDFLNDFAPIGRPYRVALEN
jgi:hypothetical protein